MDRQVTEVELQVELNGEAEPLNDIPSQDIDVNGLTPNSTTSSHEEDTHPAALADNAEDTHSSRKDVDPTKGALSRFLKGAKDKFDSLPPEWGQRRTQ